MVKVINPEKQCTQATRRARRMPALSWLLSAVFLVLTAISFVDITITSAFDRAAERDGQVSPVVTQFAVTNWRYDPEMGGIYIDVTFFKNRACTFLGMNVYGVDNQRLGLIFPPAPPGSHPSRPTGLQSAKGWFVFGVQSPDEILRMVTSHDCGERWITQTKIYP